MKTWLIHSIGFLLFSALLLNMGRFTAIQLDYLVNKAEIIELFCINKDEPELQCDGKCHLKKSFEEADVGDESPIAPGVQIELKLSPFVIQHSSSHYGLESSIDWQKSNHAYTELEGYQSLFLRPPQA